MSAEKIIEQIKKDSEKEIKQIISEAEKKSREIINSAKKEAESEARKILDDGKKQSINLKKILISKANQDSKKQVMNEKEKIIEECFVKAYQKLAKIKGRQYETLVKKLIQDGTQKLGKKCIIFNSRDTDKKIAKKLGLKIGGRVEASGGILIKSADGRIILDYTLNGIMEREKEKIRIKVGKLLFS